MIKPVRWDRLSKLQYMCINRGVGFTMVYSEVDDSFYFTIDTLPENDGFISKSRSFDIALEQTLEWLENYDG